MFRRTYDRRKSGNREIKPFVANLTGVLDMLLDFTYLLKGFLIGICAAIPLGPVAMLVIQKTLTEGRKAGFSCGLGCSVADCIFACISGLALYTAGQFIEKNTVSIQLIGGIILIGIGMIMFFSRIRETKERGHSYDPLNFVKAMMMCLTNPGALAIMLGLFAFFRMDMSEIPLFLRVLTLVSVFFGSVSYWYLFSYAVNKLGYRFPFRLLVMLNRVFGIVVVVCGIVLAAKVFI